MASYIDEIDIKGVKGVLRQGGKFDLNGRSIALYAPNGSGKSGYADAIEYFFSSDGSVEHYGKGGPDSERGGRHAIPHILANEKGVEPIISIKFRDSIAKKSISVSRKVKTSRVDSLPNELEPVVGYAPAHRVLRSHDLRRFVVDLDPRSKYSELSKWLGLEQLEKILAHLTTAEKKLAEQTCDAEIQERLRDISEHTCGEVNKDGKPIFSWCEKKCKKYLGDHIQVNSLQDVEECIKGLQEAYEEDSHTSVISKQLLEARDNLEGILYELSLESGIIASTLVLFNNLKDTNINITNLTDSAKESIFQEVWKASEQLLKTDRLEDCPICLTPWKDSRIGSQGGALVHVQEGLSSLKNISEAKSKQERLVSELITNVRKIVEVLSKIEGMASILSIHLDENFHTVKKSLTSIIDKIPKIDALPDCGLILEKQIPNLVQNLKQRISEIDIDDSSKSSEIYALTGDVVAIKDAIVRLNTLYGLQANYEAVRTAFSTISEAIRNRVSKVVDNTIVALRQDMVMLYQKIDTSGAVPDIHIEPDTQTKSLLLRISFHSDARKLPPSGYLSESRLNSLGIALFVSSVKSFNKSFPFIFLDDIVSSYDADNRARIVDLIAEELKDFQVFLTTHDDRFYQILRTRLSDKGWMFHRITKWTIDEGPRRQEDVLKPKEVEKLIDEGDPKIAGNTLRQYMEEWLDDMCAKYEAFTLHKRLNKEFDRTLYDFWEPFINRIEKIKAGFFEKRVKNQRCYDRLKSSNLLNYYSHAQANPYEWPAIGDVQYVWEAFCDFQKLFNCHSCASLLQYDHNKNKLYCTCGMQIFSTQK